MKKQVLALFLGLALAATHVQAMPIVRAESDKAVSVDNASSDKSQEGIERNGGRPLVVSGPSN